MQKKTERTSGHEKRKSTCEERSKKCKEDNLTKNKGKDRTKSTFSVSDEKRREIKRKNKAMSSEKSLFIGKTVIVKYLGREIRGVCEEIDTYLNVVIRGEKNIYIVKGNVVEQIEETL
ncbi:hypothetical protein NEPAR04_1421 [Nematocida parisii]|nr:hypothetical protein NEPAR04_1421 [Nematocida parisii]